MGLTKPRASQIYNLDYKQATRVVTVVNITLAGSAPAIVDGVSLVTNDRVLVTGQSTGSQNGIYYVTVVGSGSNGTWTRTTDANDTGEIDAGMIVMVTEGTVYADTQWKLITDNPIIVGTTALTFTQNYSANSISSGTSNVVVNSGGNVTISSAGTANVLTISSTGTVILGTVSATGNITGNYFIGNGSQLTGLQSFVGATGPTGATGVTGATGTFNGTLTSDIAGAGYSISNIATLSATTVSVTGNITGGNVLTSGLISATGNATVGNITSLGDVTGKNLNSSNADLAEMYVADANYPVGVVVEFGGDYEITIARISHSTTIAGITSTNPSYLMNSAQAGQYVLPVALTGRVPCQVIGTIAKGDRLVASDYMGVAERLDPNKYEPGCIVGKALENYDSEKIGMIEVAVGRF